MKTHAIIPIFIPHMGCKESCVFCDQKQITARSKSPTQDEVRETIETWLSTLGDVENKEIAFYGGSFTAIPATMQESYLQIAKEYLDSGKVKGIHLSTRPDCIDETTLDRLQNYGVSTIELGVQSFDDKVLALSKRGHDSSAVYEACQLIKARGIKLGIQLMVGLPGDSLESCIYSAEETVRIKPHLARIYPTLVLDDTELMGMYRKGEYLPLSREEAILRSKAIYTILDEAGIYIMRVGLKSTDIINSNNLGEVNQGAYHPAFRQLVESEIAKDKIEKELDSLLEGHSSTEPMAITIYSAEEWISNLVGQNGSNREYFRNKYPNILFRFSADESLKPGDIKIEQSVIHN